MIQNTLGMVLNYYRKKFNISLEEMAEGICSPSTLYRVEQGERIVDSLTADALLGKVGKEVTFFEIVINNEDYDYAIQRQAILSCIENGDLFEAKKKIDEYRVHLDESQKIHEQFLQYQELQIAQKENRDASMLSQMAQQTLAYTKMDSTRWMERTLYNPSEMRMLKVYFLNQKEEDSDTVIKGLMNMISYAEKYYEGRLKYEFTIELYLDIIRYCYENHLFEEVIEFGNNAIDFISQGQWVLECGEIHFLMGKSKIALKVSTNECKEELLMAYCVYDMMGRNDKTREIEKFAREEFQWDITVLEI